MSRLSPLIFRRVGPHAMALPTVAELPFAAGEPGRWLDDLRLFATGWIGGLVFFGTLIS